jgi:hypothetical protein
MSDTSPKSRKPEPPSRFRSFPDLWTYGNKSIGRHQGTASYRGAEISFFCESSERSISGSERSKIDLCGRFCPTGKWLLWPSDLHQIKSPGIHASMKTKNPVSTRHQEWIDENEYFDALRKRKPSGFSLSSTLLLVVGLHLALLAALFAHAIPKSSPTESSGVADAVENPAPKSDALSASESILNSPQKESANIKPGAGNSTSKGAPPINQEEHQASAIAASESRISAGPKIPSTPDQQPPSANSIKTPAAPGGDGLGKMSGTPKIGPGVKR